MYETSVYYSHNHSLSMKSWKNKKTQEHVFGFRHWVHYLLPNLGSFSQLLYLGSYL